MLSPKKFYTALLSANIEFFAGIPDSLLKNFCAYIMDHVYAENHIIAANEGNALAIGIGYHLATNKVPLIYLQNSGLGNIVNPLLSLMDPDVYSIPSLLLIGWRGEPNVNDEPQHKKQGRVTLKLLDAMEVPYQILSSDTTDEQANDIIHKASVYAKNNDAPYALIMRKGCFSKYELQSDDCSTLSLTREDAIKVIVNDLNEKDIVISTTGVVSRELFEYRNTLKQGHEKDFLTVGGMGHANQIALGLAMKQPNRQIFCFDGDGAVLMHMGTLAINASIQCNNYKHIVFNNGAHDSVGGQPTVGLQIDLQSIAKAVGYKMVFQAETEAELVNEIKLLRDYNGMAMLEVKVKKGFRKNLGRPSSTPIDNKKAFMGFLN